MSEPVRPLKVLLVEDSAADAELIVRALDTLPQPVEHRRVTSEAGLRQALAEFAPDVILSDFSMPGFSGHEALRIACEAVPATPFLFVSGTIGEELAIEALRQGAADYVLKDNLRRLPSALERALRGATERAVGARMERALQESEERFRSIVESSLDWIWEIDRTGRIIYSNEAVEEILGYPVDEVLGRSMLALMHPMTKEQAEGRIERHMHDATGWRRQCMRFLHRDGSVRVLISSAQPVLCRDNGVRGFRGAHHDDTARLAQEAKIRQLARIHAVLSAVGSNVLRISDRQELLLRACRIAVEQGGFKAAAIGLRDDDGSLRVAASWGDPVVLAAVAPNGIMPLRPDGHDRQARERTVRDQRRAVTPGADDGDGAADVRGRLARDGRDAKIALPLGAEPWGLLALYSDSTREFDAEELALFERLAEEIAYAAEFIDKSERLEYLAYYNPVTGLPNRAAFRERQLPRLREHGPHVIAVIDIKRFAPINQSRGRAYGDKLLRQLGQRLVKLLPEALVSHPEADAFLVAYPAAEMQPQLERLDACLQQIEQEGFVVDDEKTYLSLIGGVAHAPLHGSDGETLERNALAALAEAEKRNIRLLPFTEALLGEDARRLELEHDLRNAIEAEEFELHYQPKFDTASRGLVGAEALLRWRHPRQGLIAPADFIPILEDTGLIVPVGRWVLRTALATALRWRAQYHPSFRVAVNVSARQLRHAHFSEDCAEILEPHAGEQPIDIEVTESLLMDNVEHCMHLLEQLRDLGCRIAIDDFGTGYSSLNYLARLPVDEIKIDQSFIAYLPHSPETMGLVTNIITLAHSLSLRVVAEGVEEEEQAKLLRLLRCDLVQGYLLGRPVPAAELEQQFLMR